MKNVIDKFLDFLTDVIDNDTLIIIGVISIGLVYPENQKMVIGGLLTFLGLKKKNGG